MSYFPKLSGSPANVREAKKIRQSFVQGVLSMAPLRRWQRAIARKTVLQTVNADEWIAFEKSGEIKKALDFLKPEWRQETLF